MKAFRSALPVVALAAALWLAAGQPWWNPPSAADRSGSWSLGPARLEAAQLQSPERPGSAVFPPAQAEEVRQAVKSAQRSLNFQTELPEQVASRQRRAPSSGFFLSEGVAKVLLWLAIALAVGAIAWSMKDMWGKTADLNPPAETQEGEGSAAAIARMDQAQAGADDLAGRGDFAGAMHLLLLQSVSELRRRLNLAIAASLTSREIWARTSLPPEGKKVFADIIGRVEISWFGPHQPGQDDYLACRRSFETLTSILKESSKGGGRPPKNGPPATDHPGLIAVPPSGGTA